MSDGACPFASWCRQGTHDKKKKNDSRTVADIDGSEYLGAGANDHVATKRRMTLALLPAGAAQGYAMVEGAVVADDRGLTDDNAHAVIDEETPTNVGTGMDLDTGEQACDVRQHPRRPLVTPQPQPVRETMRDHRVQTRVGGHDLEGVACGRIAVENAADIFA